MSFVQRRLLKIVLGVVSRPRLTLIIAAIVLGGSVFLALTRLAVSSDQNKLFSSKVKFFNNFLKFNEEFPENDALYIMIEPRDGTQPPLARWTKFADQLTDRLTAMHGDVESVEARVPLRELGSRGLLFQDPAKLDESIDELRGFSGLVKLWGEKPGFATALMGSSPIERFIIAMRLEGRDPRVMPLVGTLARSWVRLLRQSPQEARVLRVGDQIPDLETAYAQTPSDLGYTYLPDNTDKAANPRHILLVQVYPRVDYKSLTAISEVVGRIRIAAHDVSRDFPEFTIGVTGRPALDADEMEISDRDSRNAEIVAMCVVFIGMSVMLRSLWLSLAAAISLTVAIGWTFGYATISVGELNLLSLVFLIALIGIGMDYLVQILMAFRREAAVRARPKAIWLRVFTSVGPPINTACLGAAGAFLVSVFTDFRGAADLGIIAGGGLVLCLASGYTVLPALLVLRRPKIAQVHSTLRYSGKTARGRRWSMATPILWIALLLAMIPFMLKAHFNPNLLDLQPPELESVKLVPKLQAWSLVVLSRNLQQLRDVRASLKDAPTVDHTDSLLDALDNYKRLQAADKPVIHWAAPSPLDAAAVERLAGETASLAKWIAAEPSGIAASASTLPSSHPSAPPIAATTAAAIPTASSHDSTRPDAAASTAISAAAQSTAKSLLEFSGILSAATPQQRVAFAARLSAWEVGFVDELKEQLRKLTPPPLDPQTLPGEMRRHYVGANGDYALYIYPRLDCWKKDNLGIFVKDVEAHVETVPNAPDVTGIASDIYHSTQSIRQSFYVATGYAIALILLLVMIDLRDIRQTLMAMSVLAFGLPMLVGLMGLIGIDWNFANFFGLPILIGAGHEYGVFLVHRYREASGDHRRAWRRFDTSDRALLLCAFITSSSFGFFWAMGHHLGLRSLGLVMALGSGCIYLAAVLVLRPFLLWRIERMSRRSTARVALNLPK